MCEQSFSVFPQDQGRIPSGPYSPQGLYPQYNTEKWSKSDAFLFQMKFWQIILILPDKSKETAVQIF